MKKLKLLLESGVIQADSALNALYKNFKKAKKALVRTEKMHKDAKKSYKVLETSLSTEQVDLELAYMLQMETKHLRIASEFSFLYAESQLQTAIKDVVKKDNKTGSKSAKKKKKSKTKEEKKSEPKQVKAAKPKAEKVKKSKTKKEKTKSKKEVKTNKVVPIAPVIAESKGAVLPTISSTTNISAPRTTIYDPFSIPTPSPAKVEKAVKVKGKPGPKTKTKSVKTEAAKGKPGPKPKATAVKTEAVKGKPGPKPKATAVKTAAVKVKGKPGPKPKATAVKTESVKGKPGPKPKEKAKPTKKDGDNLRLIEGVGPAAELALRKAGFSTFASIAKASVDDLYNKLTAISQRMAVLALDSFPAQAKLAAAGKFDELEAYKKTLNRGRV